MKNKKSMEMSPLSIVIGAALLLLLGFVIIYGVFPIFTGKQVPWLRGQTEGVTSDCDGDGVIGLSDQCPCDAYIQTKESNQACSPPAPGSSASTNCPDLCKSVTRSAKK